ncbi:protease inhibitor I42 family protein [Niabella aurantiaca]|uniref:protease inhibitor I42 family protein n=1 Tax=Niabella aurantiaca TaxID=379900 RepID=UPI0003761444|nr:protease inhibitor I42 family protein [Niabella aurantiaca]
MKKKITVKVNETFQLQLESMGGAGYSWVLEQNNEDITRVVIKGAGQTRPKGAPVGGSHKTDVAIKGLKPGTSHIRLVQKRIWETEEAPLKTLDCRVTVTD